MDLYGNINNSFNVCPGDGIGSHASLKMRWPEGRVGSSPTWGTNSYLK